MFSFMFDTSSMLDRHETLKRRVTAQLARIVTEPRAIALVEAAAGDPAEKPSSKVAEIAWRNTTNFQRTLIANSLNTLHERLQSADC
jgi:hypothetical protein